MLIRDLERKTGLERATIRFYEREGLITPVRQENGYRAYSDADANTLLKVKLLRQLGLPLEKIQALQQGREDFSAALSEQIRQLEHQIETSVRAKQVCVEIREAGTDYAHLDAQYYLELLSKPLPNTPAWTPKQVPEFHMCREYHPVRRFAARLIDYEILRIFLQLLIYAGFRVRPVSNVLSFFINYGSWFLMIPVEGILLHKFGTTPGKWLMGLRVESCNGGNLSFADAAARAWEVFRHGLGWGIPVWELWRLYKSYRNYQEQSEMDWDWNAEVIYGDWNRGRKAAGAAVLAGYVLLNVFLFQDLIKPKYRGDELTVAQFAANYNNYAESLNDSGGYDRLCADGTWEQEENSVTVYINGRPLEEDKPFQYELEDGCLRQIRYENAWTDVFYMSPLSGKRAWAAYSVVLAQDGVGFRQIWEFTKLLDGEMNQENGHIVYQNIEVFWTIETQNLQSDGSGTYFRVDENQDTLLTLSYEIQIHEAK